MYNVKDMVKDSKRVRFVKYRHGELIYTTECNFEFPVPIEDTGDGIFLAEDKAMMFMRYIRKQIEAINKERASIIQAEIDTEILQDVEAVASEGFRHPLFPNLVFVGEGSSELRQKLDNLSEEEVEKIHEIGQQAIASGKAILSAFGEK